MASAKKKVLGENIVVMVTEYQKRGLQRGKMMVSLFLFVSCWFLFCFFCFFSPYGGWVCGLRQY